MGGRCLHPFNFTYRGITNMGMIPFRIKASDDPNSMAEVYCFLFQGSEKNAYEVEIEIDSLNDMGMVDFRCSCKGHYFRQDKCKHILEAIKILNEFGISCEEQPIVVPGEQDANN